MRMYPNTLAHQMLEITGTVAGMPLAHDSDDDVEEATMEVEVER